MKGFSFIFLCTFVAMSVLFLELDRSRTTSLEEVLKVHTKMQAATVASQIKIVAVAIQSMTQLYLPQEKLFSEKGKQALAKQPTFKSFTILQFDRDKAGYVKAFESGEPFPQNSVYQDEAREKGLSVSQSEGGSESTLVFALRSGDLADPYHFLALAKIEVAELAMVLHSPSALWTQSSALIGRSGKKLLGDNPSSFLLGKNLENERPDVLVRIADARAQSWLFTLSPVGVSDLKVISWLPSNSLNHSIYMKFLALVGLTVGLALVYCLVLLIKSRVLLRQEKLVAEVVSEAELAEISTTNEEQSPSERKEA